MKNEKKRTTRSGAKKPGTAGIPTKKPRRSTTSSIKPKKAVSKKPAKRGRKLKMHPDWPLRAEGYARDGLIDKEIAKKLGMVSSTFYEYMKQFPEFSEAVKRGKAPVDVEVENLLLKRCRGYEYEETEIEYLPGEGKGTSPEITKMKKKIKQIAPDVRAHEFWLKNRKPENWRETTTLDFTEPVKVIISNAFFPKISKKKQPK